AATVTSSSVFRSERSERGGMFISVSMRRDRRMARRMRHVVRDLARMLHLAQQIVVAAMLDKAPLGDDAIEERDEEDREECRREHAAITPVPVECRAPAPAPV